MRLYVVRDCGQLSCPTTPKFERGKMMELPLKPLLHIAFVTNRTLFVIACRFLIMFLDNIKCRYDFKYIYKNCFFIHQIHVGMPINPLLKK